MASARRRWLWYLGGGLVVIALSSELALRWVWGLGNPVLVQADPTIGYRFQPNQAIRRFGNRIRYNQYSQRAAPPVEPRSPDTVRILLTGDSVLNGGALADQSETIAAYMTAAWAARGQRVEALNASAGSWGIGNQLAYLEKFGLFDSDVLIVFVGAHDLVQPTSTSAPVGRHPSFPARKPLSAWQELWTRYLWPRARRWVRPAPVPSLPAEIPIATDPEQQVAENLQALATIVALARQQQIPVMVVYTPNLIDVWGRNAQPHYKSRLQAQLNALSVPLADVHAAWLHRLWREVEPFFRDSVHLTSSGNQSVARVAIAQLCWQGRLARRPQQQLCDHAEESESRSLMPSAKIASAQRRVPDPQNQSAKPDAQKLRGRTGEFCIPRSSRDLPRDDQALGSPRPQNPMPVKFPHGTRMPNPARYSRSPSHPPSSNANPANFTHKLR